MQEAVLKTKLRMDMMEFDRFLRNRNASELCYDTSAQGDYNPWENKAEFCIVFRRWIVYKSPNTLVLKGKDGIMTLRSVREITLSQTDRAGVLRADIEYMGGIRGRSSISILVRTNTSIIN